MKQNIEQWVAKTPPEYRPFRQAVHTILQAITMEHQLRDILVIKGGILLDLEYATGRFTKDIDFSTALTLNEIRDDELEQMLNKALRHSVAQLPYGVDCIVQSVKTRPAVDKKPTFPSFEVKVGYAKMGSAMHKRLGKKQCPTIVKLDISLNEQLVNIAQYKLTNQDYLLSYDVNDLIAEKIRSLLQQVTRNRNRRQDVYDLYYIISLQEVYKDRVLRSLIQKCDSRGVTVDQHGLDNPEVKLRAEAEYLTLSSEVEGVLPDFQPMYQELRAFYRSLPW